MYQMLAESLHLDLLPSQGNKTFIFLRTKCLVRGLSRRVASKTQGRVKPAGRWLGGQFRSIREEAEWTNHHPNSHSWAWVLLESSLAGKVFFIYLNQNLFQFFFSLKPHLFLVLFSRKGLEVGNEQLRREFLKLTIITFFCSQNKVIIRARHLTGKKILVPTPSYIIQNIPIYTYAEMNSTPF